jgi:hygromycin-B 7''-O-kinase
VRDPAAWGVAEVLRRNGLPDAEPVPGYNPTYPTFVCGDAVVKVYAGSTDWRTAARTERAALALAATDPAIPAPRVLATGSLDGGEPYLVMSRVPGVAAEDAGLSPGAWLALAADLGRLVARVHALVPDGVATAADWPGVGIAEAAARSSLPPHLAAQAAGYVAGLGPLDEVFTHGDLCGMHVFVEDGRLSGVIDWGDAMVADRHCELIQPHRDLFGCDKALLRAFVAGAGWPEGDFARNALGHALRRQAVGLGQHRQIDVFMPVAERFPLAEVPTLDDLATLLFAL